MNGLAGCLLSSCPLNTSLLEDSGIWTAGWSVSSGAPSEAVTVGEMGTSPPGDSLDTSLLKFLASGLQVGQCHRELL